MCIRCYSGAERCYPCRHEKTGHEKNCGPCDRTNDVSTKYRDHERHDEGSCGKINKRKYSIPQGLECDCKGQGNGYQEETRSDHSWVADRYCGVNADIQGAAGKAFFDEGLGSLGNG